MPFLQQTLDGTDARRAEQALSEERDRVEALLREMEKRIEQERLRRGKSLPRVVHGRN